MVIGPVIWSHEIRLVFMRGRPAKYPGRNYFERGLKARIKNMIEIRQTNPIDIGVRELIAELDDYQRAIYPEQSNHLDPVEQLVNPNVCFVGAYDEHGNENNLLGIGAIKYLCHDCDYGEIKRIYVRVAGRGQGISKLIMLYLENDARKKGIKIVRLETGIYQPEAIGLYGKFGYRKCERFGQYLDDPRSVFMEKVLD